MIIIVPPTLIELKESELNNLISEPTLLPSDDCAPYNDSNIWNICSSIKSSSDGSTGVFILNSPKGQIILKSAGSLGQEYFSSVLGQVIREKCSPHKDLLSFPRIRIFGYYESMEWSLVKSKLHQLSIGSASLHIKVEKELNRPFFIVQEYVSGQDLPSLGPEKLHELFLNSSEIENEGKTHPLRQLGWLMAFDMLINNYDRLPLVWENEGNLANIFFHKGNDNSQRIVGIDQGVTTVDPNISPKGVENYLNRLTQFLDPVIKDPAVLSPRLLKVQESFTMWTGFILSHDQLLLLQIFILEGVCFMGKSLDSNVLSTVKNHIQTKIKVDWENVWANMIKLINIEFLERVLNVFNTRSETILPIISSINLKKLKCSCSVCTSIK